MGAGVYVRMDIVIDLTCRLVRQFVDPVVGADLEAARPALSAYLQTYDFTASYTLAKQMVGELTSTLISRLREK